MSKLVENNSDYGTSKSASIQILKDHGFNPIAITVMLCDEVFAFKTQEEAARAHDEFENNPKHEYRIQGYWYGLKEFRNSIVEYVERFKSSPIVYFLHEPKRYANGERITAERMEDEIWYYSLYQPFLEFMMSFYKRRDVTVEELYEGFKEFMNDKFDFIPNEHDDAKILRWSVLHCERHNSMPEFEKIEKMFN